MDVTSLILEAKARGASDLHLSASRPPVLRIQGVLTPLANLPILTPRDVEDALAQIANERDRRKFVETMELDFAYTIPDVIRLRCNAAWQRGSISLALRLVPAVIPSFEELHLPDICRQFALKPRGMVIISGPTGSGKTTTLAAMIEHLNRNANRRIVTIEDPIEYIFAPQNCTIIQRELGDDTRSFVDALKHVLRQDPDVIMVGEMRDVETAAAALTVAETGHLVFTTGHAPSASQTVERIVDLFPPHERYLAETRLASLLIGIMCQTLVPTVRPEDGGRVPAVEVMVANPAVRSLIREGKIHQLPNTIRTGSSIGMKLLDHSLAELYGKGLISAENLLAFCNDRSEIEKIMGEIIVRAPAKGAQEEPPRAPLAAKENGIVTPKEEPQHA